MTFRPREDIGSHVKSYDACSSENSDAPSLITAGGTGDATEVQGQTIDRMNGNSLAQSAVLALAYLATLADTKSLAFAVEYEESDDGTTWDTAVVIQASTVAILATASTNYRGVVGFDLDLSGRKRYVRYNITPDLSNTGTDVATFHAVAILAGYDVLAQ